MGISLLQVSRGVGAQTHLHPMDLAFETGSLTVLLGPVKAGETLQVYRAPASLEAGEVISDPPMNFMLGAVSGDMVQIDHGPLLAAPAPLAAGCGTFGLHAGLIALDHGTAEVPVVLVLAEINGSETLLHGAAGGPSLMMQMTGVLQPGAKRRADVPVRPGAPPGRS